jgi:hypothetical protein
MDLRRSVNLPMYLLWLGGIAIPRAWSTYQYLTVAEKQRVNNKLKLKNKKWKKYWFRWNVFACELKPKILRSLLIFWLNQLLPLLGFNLFKKLINVFNLLNFQYLIAKVYIKEFIILVYIVTRLNKNHELRFQHHFFRIIKSKKQYAYMIDF